MKKRMYVVTNLDGDEIYFDSLQGAVDTIFVDDKDLSDEDIDNAEWMITVKLMTEQEIADLPEYQG